MISIFKPYLKLKRTYKGGITKDELKGLNKKIYKLSSNENLLGTSPLAISAIKENIKNLNEYPDRTTAALQEALSEFYNGELASDQFICGNSGSEVLELIIRAFMNEDLEAIVSSPCFLPYEMFSRWQGAKVHDVRLLEPDYSIDTESILAAINDKTRLLFLTTPNNPTGTYIPQDQLDELIARIPEHVVIVLDEVYYHYADAPDFTTAKRYVAQGRRVIGLNSFSKTYGLASVRSGYAYSTPEISSYIRHICKPFLVNKLTLAASIGALKDKDFLHQTVSNNKEQKTILYKAFDEMGLHYWESQANFILVRPKMDAEDFVQKLLQEGIMVRPSANFGAPGCVRITIGTAESTAALIEALKKII